MTVMFLTFGTPLGHSRGSLAARQATNLLSSDNNQGVGAFLREWRLPKKVIFAVDLLLRSEATPADHIS